MSDSRKSDPAPLWGEVVYSYSRAQAIADGVLIDVSATAREVGFKWPVAVTDGVWADCVAWPEADSTKQVAQDEAGRLWDVVFMAANAAKTQRRDGRELVYELARVPRDGASTRAACVQLKLMVGPGDAGEPVVTIMQLDED